MLCVACCMLCVVCCYGLGDADSVFGGQVICCVFHVVCCKLYIIVRWMMEITCLGDS